MNTVDVEAFSRSAERASRDPEMPEWRKRFPERNVLFVGQMIPRKGVPELIEAFRAVSNEGFGLILVGDGPMWEKYKAEYAKVPGLFWEGYRQPLELSRYYAVADALVMPSKLEVWGLVVNEAMASGLPVIATTCSGATEDLILEGETGAAYESGDTAALTRLLTSVVEDPKRWKTMGSNAAERIRRFGPECYAESFCRAVRTAYDVSRGKLD